MQAIGFYLTLPFIYLISILPFPLLYLISDFFYFILFYVLGYRKNVVLTNLKNSFPEKSEKEIKALSKKFYKHLCDLFFETFKTLTISKTDMLKHCTMDADSRILLNKFYKEEKNIVLVLGHLGNWEWAGSTFSLICNQQLYVIFHPFKNKYFNDLIVRMRTRFGTKLIEMKNTFRDMVKIKEANLWNGPGSTATAFIADQSPSPENAYWTQFMNQDTAVFWGTERIARKLNYPVIFINVKKIKRGYYQIVAAILCENPSATSDGEITEIHIRKLEQEICVSPETWLWSHRRWKHKRHF
jgi:KDO2-lipid IV(A) lauroyltransferase